jgi:hypothetical protein
MSFAIGAAKTLYGRPGFEYRITVNGLTVEGWRAGSRADVEDYARKAAQMCTSRAGGTPPCKIRADARNSTSHLRGGKRTARLRKSLPAARQEQDE